MELFVTTAGGQLLVSFTCFTFAGGPGIKEARPICDHSVAFITVVVGDTAVANVEILLTPLLLTREHIIEDIFLKDNHDYYISSFFPLRLYLSQKKPKIQET